MKKTKELGITLIALVVTIIIILIIAGIFVQAVMNGNDLFIKAKYVSDKYNNAVQQEEIEIGKMTNSVEDNSNINGHRDNEYYFNVYDLWTTWLYLGGISNPEYYNGYDILNDTTLMDQVMNSILSREYLVRSDKFLLPAVCKNSNLERYASTNSTVELSDDPRIICSSQYSSEGPVCAFDRDDSTFWTSSLSESLPAYIGWDCQRNAAVYKFSIKNRNSIDTRVGDFVLQGCNYEGEWEDIQSYSHTNNTNSGVSYYTVDHPKCYMKYRLKITSEGRRGANYIQIAQLDFYYY